jgi:anti-anti-sigma factor
MQGTFSSPLPRREQGSAIQGGPMLRIEVHTVPEAATLHCKGRIVLGVECEILRCMAESRDEDCLALDLSQVHAMDAAGLGLLADLHCQAQRRRQALKIVRASRSVCTLMALTSLHSALDVSGCEEAEFDGDCCFAELYMTA